MSLFGSSGIRGLVGSRITPELVMSIGSAVGSIYDEVFIGRDTRSSGDMMVSALSAGLLSVGSDVHDGDILPTPTVARYATGYGCAIMVTASHNPSPYNGIKLWNPDGSAFDDQQSKEIEEAIAEHTWKTRRYDKLGTMRAEHGALEQHMDAILSVLQAEGEVVLDCASGPTSLITPIMLRRMGCKVTALNSQIDGHFPGRMPEPLEENLGDLITLVRSKPGAIGLAHDGDGDRIIAVDDCGRYLDGDRLLALFASFLKPDGIVVPINASMVIDDLVQGPVHRTRVGDVFVSDALKKSGLKFGGEPSGTFIFADQTFCPDGVYGAAFLAKMAQEASLAEMVDEIPSYPMAQKVYLYDGDREQISAKLWTEISSLDYEQLISVDGWRAEFDSGWFLVRFSGTEPKIRVTAEARDITYMNCLMDIADSVLERCLR
jgi:phosphoglucosamine mutase